MRLRTARGTALVAAIVLATAGCGWPMLGDDPGRSSFSPLERTITPVNASGLRELWHADIGSGARPPVTAGDSVFTLGGVDGHGELRSYDAATGGCTAPGSCTPRWTQSLTQWDSGPVVSHDTVYAGGESAQQVDVGGGIRLYEVIRSGGGYAADTGALIAAGSGSGVGPPMVEGDTVATWHLGVSYHGSPLPYFGFSLSRTAADGSGTTALLQYGGGVGGISVAPGTTSIVGTTAYMLTSSGVQVFPIPQDCTVLPGYPASCSPLWSASLAHPAGFDALPTVSHGLLYVNEITGGVEVFDAAGCGAPGPNAACTAGWRADTGSLHASGVAVDDSTLFVGSDDGHLDAFPATGCGAAVCEPTWSADLGTAVHNPSVAGRVVYAPTDDGRVAAFAAAGCGAATCTPAWTSAPSGSPVRWAPVVSGGRIFVVDDAGRMRVFGLPG